MLRNAESPFRTNSQGMAIDDSQIYTVGSAGDDVYGDSDLEKMDNFLLDIQEIVVSQALVPHN